MNRLALACALCIMLALLAHAAAAQTNLSDGAFRTMAISYVGCLLAAFTLAVIVAATSH